MSRLEQMHAAAKIIRADAADGFQSASALVGSDVALGMLIVFIRHQINGEAFPDQEGTTETVNNFLKDHGLIRS